MNALLFLCLTIGFSQGTELAQLERQVHADPDDRDACWRLAYLLYHHDELERAGDLFRTSLERHGEHAYSRYMLGAVAERGFHYQLARQQYSRVLELDPAHAAATDGQARVEAILTDLDRFRQSYRLINRDLILVLISVVGGLGWVWWGSRGAG